MMELRWSVISDGVEVVGGVEVAELVGGGVGRWWS